MVSIHALLAESDARMGVLRKQLICFNPRPPCGERRPSDLDARGVNRFQSTPSLRRATNKYFQKYFCSSVSIHALLAESDHCAGLARSRMQVSIHALLAESDLAILYQLTDLLVSIHALLAESDRLPLRMRPMPCSFNPRPPCGERRPFDGEAHGRTWFQSTPSLRRAT